MDSNPILLLTLGLTLGFLPWMDLAKLLEQEEP